MSAQKPILCRTCSHSGDCEIPEERTCCEMYREDHSGHEVLCDTCGLIDRCRIAKVEKAYSCDLYSPVVLVEDDPDDTPLPDVIAAFEDMIARSLDDFAHEVQKRGFRIKEVTFKGIEHANRWAGKRVVDSTMFVVKSTVEVNR